MKKVGKRKVSYVAEFVEQMVFFLSFKSFSTRFIDVKHWKYLLVFSFKPLLVYLLSHQVEVVN